MSDTPLTDAAADERNPISATCVLCRTLERENAALKAEVDALREDKTRLDWLEGHVAMVACEPRGTAREGTWSIGPSGNFQIWAQHCATARAAIDAARKEGGAT